MEANFTKEECPRCKYALADKSVSKDGTQEHFICLRCGYHHAVANGNRKEYFGLGAWCAVSENGVGGSAIYVNEKFFDNIGKIRQAVQHGKLFYTKLNESDNKYYLTDSESGKELEFSDDMEICFDGLRKVSL